ncbi:glycosyltransferase family 4 protein [Bacillus sp. PS06]|uniref:glycosyltransferase family 4 protein n=1 Tax=Bacillus sp. PS06 TaxID=2764176 RepID=UPI00177E04B2|nr:glycosyltransferase family 1 protein [Bacillus sp. PS06]MBD8069400.1 glycosyltransferase family 4 protein [Bacillus sp. PS06]
MKKVYINGRFLTQSVTGVQRYGRELLKAIDKIITINNPISKNYEFIILMPKLDLDIKFDNLRVRKVGALKGHLWEQMELPYYSRDGLLLSLCNTAPLIKKNQIVTIHDAAVYRFPKSFSLMFEKWYKILFRGLGVQAKSIITVSNFSKSELIKYSKIKEEKISVVKEGKEHILALKPDNKILDKYDLRDKKFIFAVSSMNPNKNFKAIIDAINLVDNISVVIAGGTNPKVFKDNQSNSIENKNIKYVGYVTDNELKSLYENALVFIYPSLYEGFGLPPLEAMACGCPVIVSNTSSLPEVCGEASIYCDPYDYTDIANKISLLVNDSNLAIKLEKLGFEQSGKFSWNRCALDVIKVLDSNI